MPNHRKESTGGIEKVSQLREDEEVEAEDKNSHFSLFQQRANLRKSIGNRRYHFGETSPSPTH